MSAHLLWLDMEMSGLEPERERPLEIATIITTGELDVVAEGPELIIRQDDELLSKMDAWNTAHHGASGLVAKVRASTVTEADAEAQTLEFINRHFGSRDRPVLCGNSIHQDRRFIRRYMPALDARLHYRMVDVSTIKELGRRWYPAEVALMPGKNDSHRALDDIRESIAELRWYRDRLFMPRPEAAVPAASTAITE
jgi:oligoribonuclease